MLCALPAIPAPMEIGYSARQNSLRLFAWHEVDNFGDRLGPALFHRISGRPIYIESRQLRPAFEGPARQIHCFLGTLAQMLEGPHRFILWGFGTAPAAGPAHHGCRPMRQDLDLDIRALRGHLTRRVLEDAGYDIPSGVPLGDPGLLAPAFYERSPHQVDDFCLVPHHTDYDEWRWRFPGFNVIDIRTPNYDVLGPLILELTKYKVIFTSSLHVTILAEAFGIPVRPMAPKLPFKFDDFYSAVGKRPSCLSEASPDADWRALYEETLAEWQPADWDPRPWLDAAPFAIPAGLRTRLTSHYRALRLVRSDGENLFPPELSLYYSHLQEPPHAVAAFHSQGWTNLRIFGPGDWIPCGRGDSPVTETQDNVVILRGERDLRHVATEFLQVGESSQTRFRVPVTHVNGNAQILVQDEQYVAKASLFIREGEAAGLRELPVTVAPPGEKLRVCVVIYSGSVSIGPVTLAALSD
jgi:hypothetical protein